eukprot:215579_1
MMHSASKRRKINERGFFVTNLSNSLHDNVNYIYQLLYNNSPSPLYSLPQSSIHYGCNTLMDPTTATNLSPSDSAPDASSTSENGTVAVKWTIDPEYVDNCEAIYKTLSEIGFRPIYAACIAEFASTQYIPCVCCRQEFGFLECEEDYGIHGGANAVIDENDNMRYYLNLDLKAIKEDAEGDDACDSDNYSYLKAMAVLCAECALSYKCAKCGFQESTHCDSIDECVVCHVMLCELCAPVCAARNDDSEDAECYTLCDKCMEDDNVTVKQINQILEKNRSMTFSSSYLQFL